MHLVVSVKIIGFGDRCGLSICADEAEALLGKRRDSEHEVSTQIKTEFMQLWDGLTTNQDAGVLVLAATNRPGELDEAVLRRSSHQYEVHIVTGVCCEYMHVGLPHILLVSLLYSYQSTSWQTIASAAFAGGRNVGHHPFLFLVSVKVQQSGHI